MRGSLVLSLVVVATTTLTSCGGEQAGNGPTRAGPTLTSTPSQVSEVEAPEPAQEPESEQATDASLCSAHSTQEIARVLGLPVRRAVVARERGRVVCTWRAREAPRVPSWRIGDPVLAWDDGIVTITRAPARQFLALEREITRVAEEANADARSDVPGEGLHAFAIGGSVSGVPIWHAMALHDGLVTAVEVSGADSRSGLAAVTRFLAEATST